MKLTVADIRRPSKCIEDHELIWVTEDIAICSHGHENIVWALAEYGRLRVEVNGIAKKLADHIKLHMLSAPAPQIITKTETVIKYYPRIYSKEEYMTWRQKENLSISDAARMLNVSRGLLSDIETGRRNYARSLVATAFTMHMAERLKHGN
jgi:DNA-binding transcriptional regulator YiaG